MLSTCDSITTFMPELTCNSCQK